MVDYGPLDLSDILISTKDPQQRYVRPRENGLQLLYRREGMVNSLEEDKGYHPSLVERQSPWLRHLWFWVPFPFPYLTLITTWTFQWKRLLWSTGLVDCGKHGCDPYHETNHLLIKLAGRVEVGLMENTTICSFIMLKG